MGMKDAWQEPGVGAMVAALDIYDEATKYKASLPVPNYEANTVSMKIKEFLGPDCITAVYMDNHPSLIKACKDLGITTEFSQPGVPQTNGLIESINGDILRGTRALLIEAGLPACFWPLAARCYCQLPSLKENVLYMLAKSVRATYLKRLDADLKTTAKESYKILSHLFLPHHPADPREILLE